MFARPVAVCFFFCFVRYALLVCSSCLCAPVRALFLLHSSVCLLRCLRVLVGLFCRLPGERTARPPACGVFAPPVRLCKCLWRPTGSRWSAWALWLIEAGWFTPWDTLVRGSHLLFDGCFSGPARWLCCCLRLASSRCSVAAGCASSVGRVWFASAPVLRPLAVLCCVRLAPAV